MIEHIKDITAQAQKRNADARTVAQTAAQTEMESRLSERMELIYVRVKEEAQNGNDWLIVEKIEDRDPFWSKFWEEPEQVLRWQGIPNLESRELASRLSNTGFEIRAGYYKTDSWPIDPPPGSNYVYWGISWKTHSK